MRSFVSTLPVLTAKAWHTACARAALKGVTLLRTDPADGPVRVFCQASGITREVRSLDDMEGLFVGLAA